MDAETVIADLKRFPFVTANFLMMSYNGKISSKVSNMFPKVSRNGNIW